MPHWHGQPLHEGVREGGTQSKKSTRVGGFGGDAEPVQTQQRGGDMWPFACGVAVLIFNRILVLQFKIYHFLDPYRALRRTTFRFQMLRRREEGQRCRRIARHYSTGSLNFVCDAERGGHLAANARAPACRPPDGARSDCVDMLKRSTKLNSALLNCRHRKHSRHPLVSWC